MGNVWNNFFRPLDYKAINPEILLTIFGLAVLLIDPLLFRDKRDKFWNAAFAMLGLGFAFLQLALFVKDGFPGGMPYAAFDGRFAIDSFAVFLKIVIVLAAFLVVLISGQYLEIEEAHFGEYYALLLFSVVGMMFMVSATDLIVLFLGLELMALCEYVLVGFLRGDRRSNEGAMKFFLLGAFSSGLLLYGMSLLYGISGSTKLSDISLSLASRPASDPISWVAMITLLAGLFFKIAAVPFHQWTPDAYEGAPTSITAFISVAPKVASFAILLRLLFTGMGSMHVQWQSLMIGVAIATMTVGNLAAVSSTNIKRFFGYSTIAHVGYLLLGVIAAADGNREGLTAVLIYLLVYTFMNLGAFSVIILMRRKDLVGDQIDDMAGLMARAPGMAILMLIFLLSLAGIPPTAGFIGKYYIFLSLIQTGHYYLAVLGVAYAVVALYYYFRIVVAMFMQKAPDEIPLATSPGLTLALGVTIGFTLAIGIYPEPFILAARNAISPFFPVAGG
ncbi:MAG TPA: NADH-quinone oxidoreductase subunit N [Terriglobia bacterium]|nr:NADH-quinone oxidoreductase subunit N [Terriglobia bacterium]